MVARKAQCGRNGAAVMRHQPGRGIDRQGRDLVRRVVSDILNVHAALGRSDDRDAAAFAIDQQRQIIFLFDVDAVGDVEPLDGLAIGAGLDRDQCLAEHFGRMVADFVDRVREADAALGIGAELLELALAASAGVDLGLDHP